MGGAEVQRVLRFVRLLPEFGWEPIVVTTKGGDHFTWDETILETFPPQLRILRIKSIEHPGFTHRRELLSQGIETWRKFQNSRIIVDRIRRRLEAFDRSRLCFPDEKNWWALRASLSVKGLVRKYRPDVLWATGFPWSTLWLLEQAHKKTGIPAVGDIRDPWSWHPQGFWSSERHRKLEQRIFTGVNHLVTATEGFKKEYLDLYPELDGRIALIRNGYDEEDCQSPKNIFNPICFNYIGSLTRGNIKDTRSRTLYTFLKALRLLIDQNQPGISRIRVNVAGSGVENTKAIVGELGLQTQVNILGNLSQEKARKLRKESDVLLLVMGNGPKAETFVPLKVYEYLAANRPILAMLPDDSEAGEIIRGKNRGLICPINNVEGIAKGIRKILNGDFCYNKNSDISCYSFKNSAEKLANLLDTISKKN